MKREKKSPNVQGYLYGENKSQLSRGSWDLKFLSSTNVGTKSTQCYGIISKFVVFLSHFLTYLVLSGRTFMFMALKLITSALYFTIEAVCELTKISLEKYTCRSLFCLIVSKWISNVKILGRS